MQDSPRPGEITELLLRWRGGDSAAAEQLTPLVYPELRRLARFHLQDRARISFSPTELVHEAYLKLVGGATPQWESRSHFFSIAARSMRQVLVDWARERLAQKRGGGQMTVALDSIDASGGAGELRMGDLVALDDALRELAQLDPRKSSALEMRYFGGMTAEEIADVLQVSVPTVTRDIRTASAWLRGRLG